MIEDGGPHPVGLQEPAHDAAEASEAREDDAPLIPGVDHVGGTVADGIDGNARLAPAGNPVVGQQEQGRGGHAEGHGGGQRVGSRRGKHGLAQAERDEDKGELAALCQGKGKEQPVVRAQSEGAPQNQKNEKFDHQQP